MADSPLALGDPRSHLERPEGDRVLHLGRHGFDGRSAHRHALPLRRRHLLRVVQLVDLGGPGRHLAIGDPWYAVIGAVGYTVIPGYITNANTSTYLQLLFGIGAATAAYGVQRGTTPAALRTLLDRLGGRTARRTGHRRGSRRRPPRPRSRTTTLALAGRTSRGGGGLVVRDLSVHFGGVKAVNGVSLKAPIGAITG